MNKTTSLIAKHEGLRLKPYKCSAGKTTIGYGRNLEDVGITQTEADEMLRQDVARTYDDLSQFDWFDGLDEVRSAVVVNMVFNLGINRFKKFKNTIHLIKNRLYSAAAIEMIDSRWADQVGKRATELGRMMNTGEWQ